MKHEKLRNGTYIFDDNHELYAVFYDEENNVEGKIEKMRIKSSNTFKVNRKKLLKNADNIRLKFEECNQGLRAMRGYGDKESYKFGSNNSLIAILNDDTLKLLLSSYGDICGFEFEEDDLFGKKIECYGDVYDCMLMMDVLKLLDGCFDDYSEELEYDD